MAQNASRPMGRWALATFYRGEELLPPVVGPMKRSKCASIATPYSGALHSTANLCLVASHSPQVRGGGCRPAGRFVLGSGEALFELEMEYPSSGHISGTAPKEVRHYRGLLRKEETSYLWR